MSFFLGIYIKIFKTILPNPLFCYTSPPFLQLHYSAPSKQNPISIHILPVFIYLLFAPIYISFRLPLFFFVSLDIFFIFISIPNSQNPPYLNYSFYLLVPPNLIRFLPLLLPRHKNLWLSNICLKIIFPSHCNLPLFASRDPAYPTLYLS